MAIEVRAKTMAAKDLKGGFVGVFLDLDGATVGIVVAEGGGKGEELGFGVLGGEGGGGEDKSVPSL